MLRMLALLAALLTQEPTMESLLRKFSDDDPSRRDESTKAIVERWKEWKDADLAKLRKAADDPEQELSGRAREALSTIELRRRLGETLLSKMPGIEEAIRTGTDARRCELLASAAA